VLLAVSIHADWLFNPDERRQLMATLFNSWARIHLFGKWRPTQATS
jgi:hypothetical protein